MKLVLATPLYPPEPGGPATHTRFLEEWLPRFGIEVTVIAYRRVASLPKGIRHLKYLLLVYRAARSSDAVFAQDTMSVGVPAYLAARLARKPFLVRVPGDHAWEQGRQRYGVTDDLDTFQTKRYRWQVELLRSISRYVVRHADKVIVPSSYFERLVGGWLGDARGSLVRIYNGIDFSVIPEKPEMLPDRPFLVSVGRLVPWKGFGGLISLLTRLPEWSLVIIGDGPERTRLGALVRENNLDSRVSFTGNVSRAQVLGWLSVADAFVLNSSFESFSYQLVEALAVGVPTIATNIGSIPEILENEEQGILVAPDDFDALCVALRSVRTESTRWSERIVAGREKARDFSAERTARAFAALIEGVVKSARI